MSNYITRALRKIKKDVSYSPLNDDADAVEKTPKKLPSVSNNLRILKAGRKLFSHQNKSFTIHRRSSESDCKKGRFRNLLDEFQTKVRSWSQEVRNLQHNSGDNKTPVTPNRRIRSILGRTPEKLYSPFSIETPPSNQWHKFHEKDDPFVAMHGWLTPTRKKSKMNALFY